MQPNFEQPEFSKNLFPGYTGIPILSPTNSMKFHGKIIFVTEIHGESHPVSMRILVMYLMTQYFSHEFSHKRITSETTYYLY